MHSVAAGKPFLNRSPSLADVVEIYVLVGSLEIDFIKKGAVTRLVVDGKALFSEQCVDFISVGEQDEDCCLPVLPIDVLVSPFFQLADD